MNPVRRAGHHADHRRSSSSSARSPGRCVSTTGRCSASTSRAASRSCCSRSRAPTVRARHRGRHHPQPRRRPRHRRARGAAPGQHDRRRPARREGPREGRGAWSARPPSCGSDRSRQSSPWATPCPTTTTTGRRARRPRGAPTTDAPTHRRATDGRRRRHRRTTISGSGAGARTIPTAPIAATRPAQETDGRRPTPRRRRSPAPTPTTTPGATTPRRSRRRSRARRAPTCSRRASANVPEAEVWLPGRPVDGGDPDVVLPPRADGRSPAATSRRPRRRYDSNTACVRHRHHVQERRLRREGRGPVRQQAGRDRARRRRAVGAHDQPRASPAATSQISGDFTQGRGQGPRARAAATARCRCSSTRTSRPSQSVSPTLGKDQLHAGIVAGIIGLALVALYMLALLPAARPRRGAPASRSPACCSSRSISYLSARRGSDAHARRRHRHHRVGRCHRRLVRRLLRTAEGRGPQRARRCARRSTSASAASFRTILAADLVSLHRCGRALLRSRSVRCAASRSSSASRPRSTSCSRTSSCTRSCRLHRRAARAWCACRASASRAGARRRARSRVA